MSKQFIHKEKLIEELRPHTENTWENQHDTKKSKKTQRRIKNNELKGFNEKCNRHCKFHDEHGTVKND